MLRKKEKLIALILTVSLAVSMDFFAWTVVCAGTRDASDDGLANTENGNAVEFNDKDIRILTSRTIKGKNLKVNLRELIKEKQHGYASVQGACTDGIYGYYLMVSTSNQRGRILKLR